MVYWLLELSTRLLRYYICVAVSFMSTSACFVFVCFVVCFVFCLIFQMMLIKTIGPFTLRLQTDGNLCVYDVRMTVAMWCSYAAPPHP